jgi:hypothetical protein
VQLKLTEYLNKCLELSARASKDWEVEGEFDKMVRTDCKKYHKGYGIRASNRDVEFIAHARSALPKVCEALKVAMEVFEDCGCGEEDCKLCIRYHEIQAIFDDADGG